MHHAKAHRLSQNLRVTALRFSKSDKELLKVFSRVHGIWWKQQIFSSVALAACMWRAGMLRARANWRSRTIPWMPLMKPDSRKRRRRGCTGPGRESARKVRISPNVYEIYDVCAADYSATMSTYICNSDLLGGFVCLFVFLHLCMFSFFNGSKRKCCNQLWLLTSWVLHYCVCT